MLIQNIRITDGLCNGTRLKIIGLYKYNIKAEIITGENKGKQFLFHTRLKWASAPEIGAKIAYFSRKSDLRVKSTICGSKVKFAGRK